jgi:hypothetical protein
MQVRGFYSELEFFAGFSQYIKSLISLKDQQGCDGGGGGGGGDSVPISPVYEPKKTGVRSAWGRTYGQSSLIIN